MRIHTNLQLFNDCIWYFPFLFLLVSFLVDLRVKHGWQTTEICGRLEAYIKMTKVVLCLHDPSSLPLLYMHFPNAHMHHLPSSVPSSITVDTFTQEFWSDSAGIFLSLELLNERWNINLMFKSVHLNLGIYLNSYLLFYYLLNNVIRMAQRKALLRLFCNMEVFSLLYLVSLNRTENTLP